jgi:hypothetical protein
MHTYSTCTFMHVRIHAYIHTYDAKNKEGVWAMTEHLKAIHLHTHTYTQIIYTYTHTYKTYARTHTHIHTYIQVTLKIRKGCGR